MDKDKRRKLLESMGIDEEAMPGDYDSSEEVRKFEELVEKAFKENRIPIECIDEVETPLYSARVVKFLEV